MRKTTNIQKHKGTHNKQSVIEILASLTAKEMSVAFIFGFPGDESAPLKHIIMDHSSKKHKV